MNNQNLVCQSIFNYVSKSEQRQAAIQFIEKVVELAGPYSYQHKYAAEIIERVKTVFSSGDTILIYYFSLDLGPGFWGRRVLLVKISAFS